MFLYPCVFGLNQALHYALSYGRQICAPLLDCDGDIMQILKHLAETHEGIDVNHYYLEIHLNWRAAGVYCMGTLLGLTCKFHIIDDTLII